VEDFDFVGVAASKKIARYNAAVAALTAIHSAGILGQRLNEKAAKKAVTPKWAPAKRAMFEQNEGAGNSAEFDAGRYLGNKKSKNKTGPGGLNGGENLHASGGAVPIPKGTIPVRNVLMKLNELRKGLVYEDVAHNVTTSGENRMHVR